MLDRDVKKKKRIDPLPAGYWNNLVGTECQAAL